MPDLFDVTRVHNDNPISECHSLHLIVRDVDGRRLHAAMQLGNFKPHLDAKCGIEIRQRFVEQECLRSANDGAAHRNPLALAARKLCRPTLKIILKLEDIGRACHALVNFIGGLAAHFQAKRHVFFNAHMGVQRIILEDHGNVAVGGRQGIDDLVTNPQFTRADFFQPGDHSEQGGFPATGRTNKNEKLAARDIDIYPVDHGNCPVELSDLLQTDRCHSIIPPPDTLLTLIIDININNDN